MNFPKRLRDLREERGYTQTFVAQNCDVSIQCISSLEAGNRNPTGSTLVALAEFFDVSIDYLMGLEADTFKPAPPLKSQQETNGLAMRIKELRLEKRLTQKELGKILGVTQAVAGKYELGQLEPNLQNLAKMAELFECSVDYLIGRSDDFGSVTVPAALGEQLSKEEKELVQIYRGIDRELQRRALAYIRKLGEVGDDEVAILQNRRTK